MIAGSMVMMKNNIENERGIQMKVMRIKDVYGTTFYIRKSDYDKSVERKRPLVRMCKKDGAYHNDEWAGRDKPSRHIHKDNIVEQREL